MGLIKKPTNYPSYPTFGKVEMIYNTNAKSLYHRLSPYTDYDLTLANRIFGDKEPYYYIYPDQNSQGIKCLEKYESRLFPAGDAPIDVIRLSRFLVSGRGVTFLAKQFLLQTGNVYNETRIYNPTSPLVAAAMSLSLGSVRPQRNFDTSAGLAGIVGSLLGTSIQTSAFGSPKINPPSGTTGTAALPYVNVTTGGKGLLRAQTANTARGHLETSWGKPAKSAGFMAGLFANFIPASQNGITYRSDEGAYGLMIADTKALLSYTDVNGSPIDFTQLFIGGGKISRKNGEYPVDAARSSLGQMVQLLLTQFDNWQISQII